MENSRQASSYLIPNALYGSFKQARGPSGYQLQGRSPSFGDALCARLKDVCSVWGETGQVPVSGAYFQVPSERETIVTGSKDAEPISLSGRKLSPLARPKRGVLAIAVLSVGRDFAGREGARGYHGLFLSEDLFAAFDDQTYGLWDAGMFITRWDGNDDLPLVKVDRDEVRSPAFKPLGQSYAEILVRELRHALQGGDVVYSMRQPDPASDQHLRLLQLGLPRKLRLEEGFATFLGRRTLQPHPTVRGSESFVICGLAGDGRFEPGKSRLLDLRRRAAGSEEAIRRYTSSYAEALCSGDLAGLLRLSRAGLPDEPDAPGGKSGGFLSWIRR